MERKNLVNLVEIRKTSTGKHEIKLHSSKMSLNSRIYTLELYFDRRNDILPKPHSKNLQWSYNVRLSHERAIVFHNHRVSCLLWGIFIYRLVLYVIDVTKNTAHVLKSKLSINNETWYQFYQEKWNVREWVILRYCLEVNWFLGRHQV